MTEFVDRVNSAPRSLELGPQRSGEVSDIVPRLEKLLAPAWSIDIETDPHGEHSIVVLPVDLDRSLAIVLYDEGAYVAMAIVVDEQWTNVQRFTSTQDLERAVVAQARRSSPS